MITNKDRLYKIIIAVLCVILAVSLYFNFKSPYISPTKEEHLGSMTYHLPEECHWVYADFGEGTYKTFPGDDGIYAVDGETGRVLVKGYIDMDTLAIATVGYNVLPEYNEEEYVVEWSNEHGEKPVGAEGLQIGTDATEDDMGSFWRATFTLDGKLYIVEVYSGTGIHGDLSYIGESIVSSIDLNSKLSDEYVK